MQEQNQKNEFVIPSWLLFAVLGIWIIAIPVIVLTYGKTKAPVSTGEILGVRTEEVKVEEKTEIDTVLEGEKSEEQEVKGVSKLAIGSPVYTINICKDKLCYYIYDEEVQPMIDKGALDKERFEKYLEEKIKPFFQEKYGQTVIVKSSKGEFVSKLADEEINFSNIYDKVNSSFISNFNNIWIDLDYKITAGTDGKYAQKYIEVDNSQQRLYVWKGGKIEKEILLSGPKYGWQVYGVFPIVDKGMEPIAPGGKYMPYWMAFYYSKKQNSWYGLHGLIWMKTEDGGRWIEPETNIGQRKSTGCIRMVVADAKYLYENFEKGDLVLIHE